MEKSKRTILIAFVLAGLLLAGYALVNAMRVPAPVGERGMHFDIVRTIADQERGLSGRPTIPDNYGMLFVFTKADRYGFWMKDMLTSIDIVWLADDGTIVKIDSSVAPSTYPNAFYPPVPVHYVLETRAGYAAAHGWEIGSKVMLPTGSSLF